MRIFGKEKECITNIIIQGRSHEPFLDVNNLKLFVKISSDHVKTLGAWVKKNIHSLEKNRLVDSVCAMTLLTIVNSDKKDLYEEHRQNFLSSLSDSNEDSLLEFEGILQAFSDNNERVRGAIPSDNERLKNKFYGVTQSLGMCISMDIRNEVEKFTQQKEASSWRRHLDSPPQNRTIKSRVITTGDEDTGRK